MLLNIMIGQNSKKSNAKKTSYHVALKYICTKTCTSQYSKKWKYIQKMIEINFYAICNIY
jgi:hypothetical protein